MKIYKGVKDDIFMTKQELQKQQLEKTCFGTKEWSKNSGICKGCEQKEDCGKIKAKKNNS